MHTEVDLEAMFGELVRRYSVPNDGVTLRGLLIERVPSEFLRPGERGQFQRPEPREAGVEVEWTWVRVASDRSTHDPDNALPTTPLDELITLAHEMGHWRSWREGLQSQDYFDMIELPPRYWPECALEDRLLILDEERRAWDYARAFLEEVGLAGWDAFDDQRRNDLAVYDELLGLNAAA